MTSDDWLDAGEAGEGCGGTFLTLVFGIFSLLVIAAIFVDCILRGFNVDFQIMDWFGDFMTELTCN